MEVREFVLGGGLYNGRFGKYIRPVVESVLVQCGITDRRVSVSEYPSYLPLIGAARSIPWELQGAAVVVDFGSTRAKRGIAFFDEDNTLSRLQILPTKDITDLTGPGKTTELAAAMINLITDDINQVSQGAPLVPKIMCSMAAYVEGGEPAKINRGAYTSLNQLSPRIADWFSERISQAAGVKVVVEFVHDCDVAACALAGRPRSAILMPGSALGVGFAPPGDHYRPIAGDFALRLSACNVARISPFGCRYDAYHLFWVGVPIRFEPACQKFISRFSGAYGWKKSIRTGW